MPGSFTLTHRSVFMQTHFVGGYRSKTVSKFSHGAPAPPSSRTPALAPPRPRPRPPPEKLCGFRTPQLALGPHRAPAPRAQPLLGHRVHRTPTGPRGERAPPHRLDGAEAPPAPRAVSRGRAPFPKAPREGEPQPRCARGGPARPGKGQSSHPPAQRRGPVSTDTSVTRAPPCTCPLLLTRSKLPPRGRPGTPSRRAGARGSALRGRTGTRCGGRAEQQPLRQTNADKEENNGDGSSPCPSPACSPLSLP